MSTMTATQADAVWAAIDDQRERTYRAHGNDGAPLHRHTAPNVRERGPGSCVWVTKWLTCATCGWLARVTRWRGALR